MAEIRFDGLGYRQTLRAYDFIRSRFKQELDGRSLEVRRLEVFFSKYRMVLWLSMFPVNGANSAKEALAQAVTCLCRRFSQTLPDTWSKATGLLTFYGDELLSVYTAGLVSSQYTPIGNKTVEIRSSQHYWREMAKNMVYIDNYQRDRRIRQLLRAAAAVVGGEIVNSPIINEAITECEQPVAMTVDISPELLDLPEILVSIILEKNRFFSLRSEAGLFLPKAVYITNRGCQPPDLNREMHRAWEDYFQDLTQTLPQRLEGLKSFCYLSKLGSYYEKQQRLQKIALTMASQAEAGEDVCAIARQASQLAKIDVATMTCSNHPEYLGYLAATIALEAGATPMVVSALIEHWHPGKYSGKLPHTLVGALLGVADRLDSICGQYYQSEFKLSQYRSVINWFDEMIAIIASVPLDVSTVSLLKFSLSLYESQGLVPWQTKDLDYLVKIFNERLYHYLKSQEYPEGIAAALTSPGSDNVFTVLQKAAAMQDSRLKQTVNDCAEACKLLDRVSAGNYNYEEAAREFLEQAEEVDLFEVYLVTQEEVKKDLQHRNMEQALARLAKLKVPLQRFIDGIDLDTPDKPLRFNRMSLLGEIRQLYHTYGDFGLL